MRYHLVAKNPNCNQRDIILTVKKSGSVLNEISFCKKTKAAGRKNLKKILLCIKGKNEISSVNRKKLHILNEISFGCEKILTVINEISS